MIMFFKKNKNKEPVDIQEVLLSFKRLSEKVDKLNEKLEDFEKKSQSMLQGVGVVRFNPFSETGSNQSFSLAILDRKKDGVVITSFYSREGSNVYGKTIKNGESEYSLSEEEQKAITLATKIDIKNDKNGK